MLGTSLSIVIPLVVIAYGIWLVVRMVRNCKTGGCAGGCGDCPYAGECHVKDARPHKEERRDG